MPSSSQEPHIGRTWHDPAGALCLAALGKPVHVDGGGFPVDVLKVLLHARCTNHGEGLKSRTAGQEDVLYNAISTQCLMPFQPINHYNTTHSAAHKSVSVTHTNAKVGLKQPLIALLHLESQLGLVLLSLFGSTTYKFEEVRSGKNAAPGGPVRTGAW